MTGPVELTGYVRKGIGGFYYVETAQGLYQCTARGKFRKERISPYAGDRVRITAEEDMTGAIQEILPRKNFLVRPPGGQPGPALPGDFHAGPGPGAPDPG